MKYIFFAAFFLSTSVRAELHSKSFEGFDEGQTAISIFAGQPSFVRYDFWLNWKSALQFDVGYHFDKYFYASINYTSYFYNTRDFLRKQRNFWNSLLFYYGPGFFGGFASEDTADESFKMGVRAFGGAEYLFDGQKYAIRAELGPAFFFQGSRFLGLQGALGLTYYWGDHSKNRSFSQVGIDEPKAKKIKKKKLKKSKESEISDDDFDDF